MQISTRSPVNVMAEKTIGGFDGKIGMIPPKSGNASLTDDEVITSILYMTDITGSSEENTTSESPVLRDKNKRK
jgi:hypothetical protein